MNALLKGPFLASRPFSWVNTAFPFAAAWLVAGLPLTWVFWVGVLFFLFPYNLAMYGLNDIFDYESDQKNPRKASVEGARLDKAAFRPLWIAVLICCLPFLFILLSQGGWPARLMLLASAFAVVSYSVPPLRFKVIPFLDSTNSSLHFWTPLAYGVLVSGQSLSTYGAALAAYFLWGLASHAFGSVQDIPFDREADIGSIGTVIGAKATVWFSTTLYLIAALLIALAYPVTLGYGAALLCLLYLANTVRFHGITDETSPTANAGWKVFLALNMATGAYLTAAYLTGTVSLPLVMVPVIAGVTGIVFYAYLVRGTKSDGLSSLPRR
ncbi:MAG: prenyltransferase [bacterium]